MTDDRNLEDTREEDDYEYERERRERYEEYMLEYGDILYDERMEDWDE